MEKEITTSTKQIYKGKVISFEVDKVLCPNGIVSKREIVRHPGGVCILGEVDNKIIFERQYRYPYHDFIIELPAGKLEKNENPESAAIREFEEETGYRPGIVEYVGEIYPSVGYTDEVIRLYIAKKLVKTKTNFDIDENIEILLLDKLEIERLLSDNVIKDAKTIILLNKYFKNN